MPPQPLRLHHAPPPSPPAPLPRPCVRSPSFVASRRLLGLAGIATRQYVPQRESVVLQLRVA